MNFFSFASSDSSVLLLICDSSWSITPELVVPKNWSGDELFKLTKSKLWEHQFSNVYQQNQRINPAVYPWVKTLILFFWQRFPHEKSFCPNKCFVITSEWRLKYGVVTNLASVYEFLWEKIF